MKSAIHLPIPFHFFVPDSRVRRFHCQLSNKIKFFGSSCHRGDNANVRPLQNSITNDRNWNHLLYSWIHIMQKSSAFPTIPLVVSGETIAPGRQLTKLLRDDWNNYTPTASFDASSLIQKGIRWSMDLTMLSSPIEFRHRVKKSILASCIHSNTSSSAQQQIPWQPFVTLLARYPHRGQICIPA